MLPVRKLGKNGPELTNIGFGAWAIGGPWKFGWGPQDDKESIRAIETALALGINWIDTAAVYGLGHSEELVGKAIRGKRDKVIVATKCGLVWDNNRKVSNNIEPGSVVREVENSLKRLGTDYIDLYQIHWPDRKTPEDAAWEAMLGLQKSGKIRFAGVSNFNVQRMETCLTKGHIDSLQPPYSLLRRKVETSELPFCKEHGIGVVAYSPMMSGLLTGKFDKSKLSTDDWRRGSPYFKDEFLDRTNRFVESLAPIALKYGKTIAQLSIAWVLANPVVTSAIVGARRPEQVEEIVGGSGWSVEPDDMKKIEELSKTIFGSALFSDL
jgi:aryl-alcohol dehydrogenase-like predicted oxidoreductase